MEVFGEPTLARTSMPPYNPPRAMGERFGNYEVIRRLAQGGMAEVLLAKQRGMGGFERLVCLKRILPHLSAQEDFLKMFQDEARIAANLIHPNIAQIYDIAQQEEDTYIAMEYVRGEDLRRVYNQEVARGVAIPPHIAAQVMMGAAAGLDYAHRQTTLDGKPLGIVHRDISPQNILVTYDGHVKLIDFGVAKAAGKLIETRSGVLKGKYSYMSPEQASGDPVDGRTDIFAMGITLYEITTGTRLFKRENELETLHAVIACNVPRPSQVVPGYDADLEAIVLKALAYDADNRYTTAGEMERALERYLLAHGHPTSAANLAQYMHDLFAEKLADEALFGGPPWSEPATASHLVAKKTGTVLAKPEEAEKLIEQTLVEEAPPPKPPRPPPRRREEPVDDWDTDEEPEERTVSVYQGSPLVDAPAPPPEPEPVPEPEPLPEPPPPPSAADISQVPLRPLVPDAPVYSPPQPKLWPRVALALVLLGGIAGGALWWRHHKAQLLAAAKTTAPTFLPPEKDMPPPQDGRAYVSVTAPIPMEVTLGSRYIGDTPVRNLPMEPGTYRIKLHSKNEGLTLRRTVKVEAGTPALVEIMPNKGLLAVTAKPWAWVQLGLRPPAETPQQFELIEGDYTLLFECPDGKRKLERVTVTAGNTVSAGIGCERP